MSYFLQFTKYLFIPITPQSPPSPQIQRLLSKKFILPPKIKICWLPSRFWSNLYLVPLSYFWSEEKGGSGGKTNMFTYFVSGEKKDYTESMYHNHYWKYLLNPLIHQVPLPNQENMLSKWTQKRLNCWHQKYSMPVKYPLKSLQKEFEIWNCLLNRTFSEK